MEPIFLAEHGCGSLMTPAEPHLVTLIHAMVQIQRCLRASKCIGLDNDLIKGRPLENKIIEWKISRCNYNESAPVLGRKWWRLFRKRWHRKLISQRGQKFTLERKNSLTYSNTKKTDDETYAALVNAGNVATSNEPSFYYNGPFVIDYHLTHSQNCLALDEVGSDTSQKGDKYTGRAKYFCDREGIPY